MDFADFIRSGNLAVDPQVYEVENEGMDREGVLWEALERLAPWTDRVLLDLGCGSGFWLPRYSAARRVIGVEPDPSLLPLAQDRPGGAEVLPGSAESLPLEDGSVDVVHARFAYFFPSARFDPVAGLREAARVLRPGGRLVVVDNDTQRGEFADLLRVSSGAVDQGRDDFPTRWWAGHGAQTHPVLSSWSFDSRADLERVLRLEFPADLAEAWLEEHPDRTWLSYGYLLHVWQAPGGAEGTTHPRPGGDGRATSE